ncbi:serine hydrolase [Shewanella surugensis]|uniref:Serine hydrolase n=1 Tax=Shewanella surugensis TaxID=212020 RepID=A0ABT0LE73_9GAMM|nr:serine hydrolase [Shewanella surugensis]
MDHHLKQYVEDEDFQGVVLVAKEGSIIFKSAYGDADLSNHTPNTTDKKFLIGSLTRGLTVGMSVPLNYHYAMIFKSKSIHTYDDSLYTTKRRIITKQN